MGGDGGTRGGDAGPPPVDCAAVLGEACDATTPCDLGLSCQEGTCACTSDICAIGCFESGTPDLLRATSDAVFFLVEDESSGWQLISIPVATGAPAQLREGTGGAALALYEDALFLVHDPEADDSHLLEQMGLDGAAGTTVVSSIFLPASMAVGTDELFLGDGVRITRFDRSTGDPAGQLGMDVTFVVANWLTLRGDDLLWVNDNQNVVQNQDVVFSTSLTDGASTRIGGAEGIAPLRVCPDGVYWASKHGIERAVPTTEGEIVAGGETTALACDDSGLYAISFEYDAERTTYWALSRVGADGTKTELAWSAPGGVLSALTTTNRPQSLAAVGSYLVWTHRAGDPESPWRVLRRGK